MKNKKLKCVISFLLALVVLVSMPLDITANAFAIETAWVTYAIIAYLAAMGITFTTMGGVQALENAVNNAWDECWGEDADAQRAHLCEIITFRPPSGTPSSGQGPIDPIEAAFMFGSAACALIMKFVEWLKANGWGEGEEVTSVISDKYITAIQYKNGSKENIVIKNTSYRSFEGAKTTDHFQTVSLGDIFSKEEITYVKSNNVITNGITFEQSSSIWWGWQFSTYSGNMIAYRIQNGSQYGSWINTYKYITNAGYTESNIIGFTFSHEDDEQKTLGVCYLFAVMDDGTLIRCNYVSSNSINCIAVTESAIISIPDTITEFDVDENKVVEINFDVFSNSDNITTPEELGEAVKQQIIDTGTVPQLTPTIETLPAPTPTPIVPVPETPPELEDIEDLGLPSLGQALFSKFPFCIPNDLRNVFMILKAEPETPYWEVNLTGEALGIDSNFVIDFSEYEIVGQMSRWGSVISFCLFLIINTKRLIGW